MIRNRKGVTGATIAWIPAAFIIMLILFLFFGGFALVKITKSGSFNLKISKEIKSYGYYASEDLTGFLNEDFKNSNIYDFLKNADIKNNAVGDAGSREFNEKARNYFSGLYPCTSRQVVSPFMLLILDYDAVKKAEDRSRNEKEQIVYNDVVDFFSEDAEKMSVFFPGYTDCKLIRDYYSEVVIDGSYGKKYVFFCLNKYQYEGWCEK